MTRGSGWGTFHRTPDDSAGGMLRKSRLGKEKRTMCCQACVAEGAEQLDCLCVLCDECAKEHICDARRAR